MAGVAGCATAEMMRRLVKRHKGILPLDTVESIWRVIIATFTYVQAPFSVHADREGLLTWLGTADHEPDVVPVHPCWEGDVLWFMCGTSSVKVRNIAANPNVALHWQVRETAFPR